MNSRRDKIEQMLRDEPEDIFLRYALAMELEKEEQPQLALDLHRSLIDGTPPYVASYFRSAQILVGMDQVEQARPAARWYRGGSQAKRLACGGRDERDVGRPRFTRGIAGGVGEGPGR